MTTRFFRSLLILSLLLPFYGCGSEEAGPKADEKVPGKEASPSKPIQERQLDKKEAVKKPLRASAEDKGRKKGLRQPRGRRTTPFESDEVMATYQTSKGIVEVRYFQFQEVKEKLKLLRKVSKEDDKIRDNEVWKHILQLHEAVESGLHPTTKDFQKFCMRKIQPGPFNMEVIKRELEIMEIPFDDFAQAMKEKLVIDLYSKAATLFTRFTEEEVEKEFFRQYKKYRVSYLCFNGEAYLDRVTDVEDEEIKLEEAEAIARQECEKFLEDLQNAVAQGIEPLLENKLKKAESDAEQEIKAKGIEKGGQKFRIKNSKRQAVHNEMRALRQGERSRLFSKLVEEKGLLVKQTDFFSFIGPVSLVREIDPAEQFIRSQKSLMRIGKGRISKMLHDRKGKGFYIFRVDDLRDPLREEMNFETQWEIEDALRKSKQVELEFSIGNIASLRKRYDLKLNRKKRK